MTSASSTDMLKLGARVCNLIRYNHAEKNLIGSCTLPPCPYSTRDLHCSSRSCAVRAVAPVAVGVQAATR